MEIKHKIRITPFNYKFVIQLVAILTLTSQSIECQNQNERFVESQSFPIPIPSASYLSLDGLSLVVIFDKPVNLSASIESVERRFATIESGADASTQTTVKSHLVSQRSANTDKDYESHLWPTNGQEQKDRNPICPDQRAIFPQAETNLLIQGIQICAKILTKKTLKLLHKYRLYNCLWPTQNQFIIELSKGVPLNQKQEPIRVSFQRGTISTGELDPNDRELSVDLNRLPLESLGVPLAPKLALTGPNQVAPCGHFTLSAHLSSPYGTQPQDTVTLSWSVDRIGLITSAQQANMTAHTATTFIAPINMANIDDPTTTEAKWQTLKELVSSTKGNNLILASSLLQRSPQIYLFQVRAKYSTSLTSISLNASHQVTRVDSDTPMGTIYGSHLLSQQENSNTNQEILLVADVQVPDCAVNVKQVGLYWQVSDSRVRFEQTYAPFYIIKRNSLPEQSQIEFRLNLFYGIRVKKFTSASTLITTGDSILEAKISDGVLVMSLGQEPNGELQLFGSSDIQNADKYTYLWSCFDGKTAHQCNRNSATNSTRYDIVTGTFGSSSISRFDNDRSRQTSGQMSAALIGREMQRESALKLPMSWLEPESQLWFGLQRFDRQSNASPQQNSKTEYTLVSVQSRPGPNLSIGPLLFGRSRHRATVRNPLTGAMLLLAGTQQVVLIGRLGPAKDIGSFAWHIDGSVQPLYWTSHNSTNKMTGQQELISELHLNPSLLVAHSHQQVQLVACSSSSGVKASVSLSLDIVQGVSQCQVETTMDTNSGSLIVSVEFCNIPLGISPINYQIYVLETTSSDGFIEANQPVDSAVGSKPLDDDYMNEADEMFFEAQAEPLTMPQLSPVFALKGLAGALSPLGNTTSRSQSRTRLRFAARVCDRISTCRMFYSNPVALKQILGFGANKSMNFEMNNRLVEEFDKLEVGQTKSMEQMIEGAKRANLAGNSIAAISILNGVLGLTQRMVISTTTGGSEGPMGGPEPLRSTENYQAKLQDLMQVSARDILQYTSSSLQRLFHYSDSGQTNLVTQSLARILSLGELSVELKFRAMRLLAQLSRRTIDLGLNLKANCLADFKSLQSAYESIFGTFSQYSVGELINGSHQDNRNHRANQQTHRQKMEQNNNNNQLASSKIQVTGSLQESGAGLAFAASTPPNNRRKRDDAILAYLRLARQSYRSLVAATAAQLPLGAAHQLVYTANSPMGSAATRLDTSSATASLDTTSSRLNERITDPQPAAGTQTTSVVSPSNSAIVSSLLHQIHLAPEPIELDLNDFGSVNITFDDPLKLSNKLRQMMDRQEISCRNNTQSRCSSFVISLTTFSGKAPFRSLDARTPLRVPIIELSLLSPIDGSNLVDLMESTGSSTLRVDDFSLSITWTVASEARDTFNESRYKCYRFSEVTNEWIAASPIEADELPFANGRLDSSTSQGESEFKRIRCKYSSLGVFGAFKGEPAKSDSSTELSIILGIVGVIGVVVVFSLLGCFASSSRESNQTRKDSIDTSSSNSRDYEPHVGSAGWQQQRGRRLANYPLAK